MLLEVLGWALWWAEMCALVLGVGMLAFMWAGVWRRARQGVSIPRNVLGGLPALGAGAALAFLLLLGPYVLYAAGAGYPIEAAGEDWAARYLPRVLIAAVVVATLDAAAAWVAARLTRRASATNDAAGGERQRA